MPHSELDSALKRLAQKNLPMTNTLAYFGAAYAPEKKGLWRRHQVVSEVQHQAQRRFLEQEKKI